MSYLSIEPDTAETYSIQGILDVMTFQASEWADIDAAIRKPRRGLERTWEEVLVAGEAASLVHATLDGTDAGWLLVVERGESVILIGAAPSSRSDGSKGNPVSDRQVFLSVVENLRPYQD